jgi:sucrose-phosphate synthase
MSTQSLYIQMFSIHGLLRSQRMELGRDADTGGQINYVIELGRHLSRTKEVEKVDLFTRLIVDKTVSEDYAQPIEKVNEKFRIVRIQCGGRKYFRKELLWPHLDEYIDKTIKFIKRENAIPDVVHGHYPDAGYVAMHLSRIFGVPFVFTGHSLGRAKKQKLLNEGSKEAEINKKYKIDHRIAVEEELLKYTDLIVASTTQEVNNQYGKYQNGDLPDFQVIPPGLNLDKFYPYYHDILPESEKSEAEMYAQASILQELNRFFIHPDKPLILALSRPDERKNISGLVKAYGEERELQTIANLAVFAGIRKDIETMEENERDVLTRMLLLMDKYDLYGKMAIPKKHDFEYEVPELYRLAASKRGVFVNPAWTEPFGLTLLEASATGLPVVSTHDGGPQDIIANCQNGIHSKNGIMKVRKYYTWERHAQKYTEKVKHLVAAQKTSDMQVAVPSDSIGKRLVNLNYFLITDIDYTLIGGNNGHLQNLIELLIEHRMSIGFGVATGRDVTSAIEFLNEHGVHHPDVIISSVGTEIYYGKALQYGQGWETHISNQWDREKIVTLLERFDFLRYQEESNQSRFKISYYTAPGKDRMAMIHNLLSKNKCRYCLIYSGEKYLDILPYRASKGKAIRYLSYKWEIPLANFLVCGDSGNDEEMLRGEPMAVVVGNYRKELEKLKGARNVYFAESEYAGGILEGIQNYGFIEKARG